MCSIQLYKTHTWQISVWQYNIFTSSMSSIKNCISKSLNTLNDFPIMNQSTAHLWSSFLSYESPLLVFFQSIHNSYGLQMSWVIYNNPHAPVYSPSFTPHLKSPLTPDVCVETCDSLNTSLASLAQSEHSDSPQHESETLERIEALTGVRHQWRTPLHAAVSACLRRLKPETEKDLHPSDPDL